MRPTKIFNLALATVALGVTSVFGQISSTEATACNLKTAQTLVEQQVAESKSVVERPKRIKILLRSADFLWTLDPTRSREYFIEAYKNASEHFAANGFEKANVSRSGNKGSMSYTQLPDQRSEVIKAVAKRDPELAKKFTEQLFADYEKSAADREQPDKTREQTEILILAADNAKTNPELSRDLFRRVMRYPLIQGWFGSLYSAASNNPALAESIYLEALRNYRNENPRLLLHLSGFPFGRGSPFGHGRMGYGTSIPNGFVANPDLQRAFLNTFFASIQTFASNPSESSQLSSRNDSSDAVYMVTALTELEPIIVEQLPDMLQKFSEARSAAVSLLTEEMQKEITGHDRPAPRSNLTFDDQLKQLEEDEIKGKLTDSSIAQMELFRIARQEENYKKFEPWLNKIRDEKLRADVISDFWITRTENAINEQRFSEAEKMAANVSQLDHRVLLLFRIAQIQLRSINDQGSAFDTLNSVSKLARSAPNSVAKARVLFSLAGLYERLNHTVALDELSEAVRVVNQLENPDLFDNTVTRQISGGNFTFMTSSDLPGNNFEGLFTDMGKRDFEMSLANARSFDDKYFRTIAVIAIAKNCIKAKPAAAPKKTQ